MVTPPQWDGGIERHLDPNWRSLARPRRPGPMAPRCARTAAPVRCSRRAWSPIKDVTYGEARQRNRLDVYRPLWAGAGALRGGYFQMGGKSREAVGESVLVQIVRDLVPAAAEGESG